MPIKAKRTDIFLSNLSRSQMLQSNARVIGMSFLLTEHAVLWEGSKPAICSFVSWFIPRSLPGSCFLFGIGPGPNGVFGI